MELYNLPKDIATVCVTATSFPMGVVGAFQQLEKLIRTRDGRTFYGISRPGGNGSIVYRAAVNELYEGEAAKLGCEVFIIRKGIYISETLFNWKKDETVIGRTFGALLQDPRIDHNGACIEIYINDADMICMVRIDINED